MTSPWRRLRFCVLAALMLAGTAQAWQPTGWVYMDWPWAFDSATEDWYWFSEGDMQWINATPPGNGWSLLPSSSLAHGWSYWNGEWAYDADTGAWCWRNVGDTQSVVNMRTGHWSLLGQEVASDLYLVVDLSSGPLASSYPVSYLSAVPSGGWTDTYKSSKLVLRKIAKGTFTMGSPSGELGHRPAETQHTVTLTKDFYLGVFEITQRQWELVMGNRPSYFNHDDYYQTRPVERVSTYDIRENPDSLPISPHWPQSTQVHTHSFMGKLRTKTGVTTFDLPTESQWEYACRAGTTTALNSGKNLTDESTCPNMNEVGRYWSNGGSAFLPGCMPNAGTALVGSYLANGWGLYDMHGNVWEICLDFPRSHPETVSDPVGAPSGEERMDRGGGWHNDAGSSRSAVSDSGWPGGRSIAHGFRIARHLP